MKSEYEINAEQFCKRNNVKITISYKDVEYGRIVKGSYNNLYRARIDRNHKTYSFDFHDSVYNYLRNERPTKYDVLACLTKYEVYGDVWDFATEFGYEITSKEEYRNVERIFKAVQKEYKNVLRLFGDVIDELWEIW